MTLSFDPQETKVVLIGTSKFRVDQQEHLPDLPAVTNNISGLAGIFMDPEIIGIPDENIVKLLNEDTPKDILRSLNQASREAKDGLIVYYSGHGLVGKSSPGLFLAISDTTNDDYEFDAIELGKVKLAIRNSGARQKVLILDCCFSGRALGNFMSSQDSYHQANLDIEGVYTLASAPANQPAIAPKGAKYTAFTGILLNVLNNGVNNGKSLLTINDLYEAIRGTVLRSSKNFPEPQKGTLRDGSKIAIAYNKHITAVSSLTGLPDYFKIPLSNPFPSVRKAAAEELSVLLNSSNRSEALQAYHELTTLLDDDSRMVSTYVKTELVQYRESDPIYQNNKKVVPRIPPNEIEKKRIPEIQQVAFEEPRKLEDISEEEVIEYIESYRQKDTDKKHEEAKHENDAYFLYRPPLAEAITRYSYGNELYDDSFVLEAPDGEFLGEFGVGIVSSAFAKGQENANAFEVWLFDKNDVQTIAKVIVSSKFYNNPDVRQRLASKGELVEGELRREIVLETASVYMIAQILEVSYVENLNPKNGIFEEITIRLSVWSKDQKVLQMKNYSKRRLKGELVATGKKDMERGQGSIGCTGILVYVGFVSFAIYSWNFISPDFSSWSFVTITLSLVLLIIFLFSAYKENDYFSFSDWFYSGALFQIALFVFSIWTWNLIFPVFSWWSILTGFLAIASLLISLVLFAMVRE